MRLKSRKKEVEDFAKQIDAARNRVMARRKQMEDEAHRRGNEYYDSEFDDEITDKSNDIKVPINNIHDLINKHKHE